jgi:hypothetical protein
LPEEHALTTVIERNLRSCPAFATGVELLNFGVSGYGTGQEYVLLGTHAAALHPDMVLVAFYAGNDVANNVRALSAADQMDKPFFIHSPEDSLALDDSFRSSAAFQKLVARDWRNRLINASYLLQAFKQVTLGRSVMPDPKPLEPMHLSDLSEPTLFAPEYAELFAPPRNESWGSAWSVTEKLLVSMRDRVKAQQAQFGIVIIPAPVQVLPTQKLRRAAMAKFGLEDLEYPVERIARAAAAAGISFVDLREALRNEADAKRVFLYGFAPRFGDGHLNGAGNAVSGAAIARWLCDRPRNPTAMKRLDGASRVTQ